MCYSPDRPGGMLVDELRTENPSLEVPLPDLFAMLD
jgi:hypothetical protein